MEQKWDTALNFGKMTLATCLCQIRSSRTRSWKDFCKNKVEGNECSPHVQHVFLNLGPAPFAGPKRTHQVPILIPGREAGDDKVHLHGQLNSELTHRHGDYRTSWEGDVGMAEKTRGKRRLQALVPGPAERRVQFCLRAHEMRLPS